MAGYTHHVLRWQDTLYHVLRWQDTLYHVLRWQDTLYHVLRWQDTLYHVLLKMDDHSQIWQTVEITHKNHLVYHMSDWKQCLVDSGMVVCVIIGLPWLFLDLMELLLTIIFLRRCTCYSFIDIMLLKSHSLRTTTYSIPPHKGCHLKSKPPVATS